MTCATDCKRPTPAQAHCGACHLTMASVFDFDRHRRDGRCLDPASVGLVEVDRLWSTPEGHRARELDAAKLADVRARRAGGGPDGLSGAVGTSGKGGASVADSGRAER